MDIQIHVQCDPPDNIQVTTSFRLTFNNFTVIEFNFFGTMQDIEDDENATCDPWSLAMHPYWWWYVNGPTPPWGTYAVLGRSTNCGATTAFGYDWLPLSSGVATMVLSE